VEGAEERQEGNDRSDAETAADEDETFEGLLLRGSGSIRLLRERTAPPPAAAASAAVAWRS
jgi:hypothetical protein